MRLGDFLTGVFILTTSLIIFYVVGTFPSSEGIKHGGGPAAYPRLLAVLFAILGIILLLQSLRVFRGRSWSNRENVPYVAEKGSWGSLLFIATLLGAYLLLLPSMGFILTTFGFLFGGILKLHGESLRVPSVIRALAIAGGTTVLIYVVFHLMVNVALPGGVLGELDWLWNF